MAANGSGLQLSTIRNIAMAWILTLPTAMMLSAGLYFLFLNIFLGWRYAYDRRDGARRRDRAPRYGRGRCNPTSCGARCQRPSGSRQGRQSGRYAQREADLIHRVEIGTEKHRTCWLEAVTGASTLAEEFAKSHGKKVGEVMTTGVISVTEETRLPDIAALFERKRI